MRLLRRDRPLNVITETRWVQFVIFIPCSVHEEPQDAEAAVQYGHGLFMSKDEVTFTFARRTANRHKLVLYAVDWNGLSRYDLIHVAKILLSDPSGFVSVAESLMQGMINQVVLSEWMTSMVHDNFTSLLMHSEVSLPFKSVSFRVKDPLFYGNSQGSVLGGAFVSLHHDIDRAVLGVPGAPFALLLSRSIDFTVYNALLHFTFHDERDIVLYIALMQQLWDPSEAGGWLRYYKNNLVNKKQVLLQDAIGDAEVTTLGADLLAHAYNVSTVYPQTRPHWNIPERLPPFHGSALVEWRFLSQSYEPEEDVPAPKNYNHECVRELESAQAQLALFLTSGVVENFCDGVCEQATC